MLSPESLSGKSPNIGVVFGDAPKTIPDFFHILNATGVNTVGEFGLQAANLKLLTS